VAGNYTTPRGIQRQVASSTAVVYQTATFTQSLDTTVYTLGDRRLLDRRRPSRVNRLHARRPGGVVQLSFVTANGSAVTIADATLSVRRCKIKKTPRRSGYPRSVCTCSRATWRPRLAIVNGDGAVYIVRDGAAVYIGPPNV
jgi:hypothetical protein